MSKITTGVEEITPAIAVKWLESNTHNRKLKEKVVAAYASMMLKDEWEVNGEAIKFDVNHVLLDGQHRLWAVIEANKSIRTLVIRGLPPEVMDTLDTGRMRSAADVLQIEGQPNALVLASAAKMVYSYQLGDWGKVEGRLFKNVPNRTVLETVASNNNLLEAVKFVDSRRKELSAFIPMSLGTATYYIFWRVSPEMAEEFFTSFAGGADLGEGNPILNLRNTLYRIKRDNRTDLEHKAALIIKAWNLFIRGKTSARLDWRKTIEEFPVVDHPAKVKRRAS